MAALTAEQRAITADIRDFATANGLPPLLLVALGWLENSSFDPWNTTGDNGQSVGIFQIHLPAHGGPAEKWLGREGTQAAMRLMLWRWRTAYDAMGFRFDEEPVEFLQTWWQPAQGGSALPSYDQCRIAVAKARLALAEVGDEEPPMTVEKPPIAWFGCAPHNYTSGRNPRIGHEAIVIHTTAGQSTIEQLAAWFGGMNRDRNGNLIRGSTNFGVDVNGAIGQFVALTDTPIANGQEEGVTGGLFSENQGISANLWTISIEHLDRGVPGSVTDIQFERSAWLAAWLFDVVLFRSSARPVPTIDRTHVLGHYQSAPASRPHCPSWPEERFTRYIARVAAIVETGNPEPPRDLVRDLIDVVTVEMRQHEENERLALAAASEERMRADHLKGIVDALRG